MNEQLQLQLQNDRQKRIADLLWQAQDPEMVKLILKTFGHDALVVYHMMIAAFFDSNQETDIAEPLLQEIFNK